MNGILQRLADASSHTPVKSLREAEWRLDVNPDDSLWGGGGGGPFFILGCELGGGGGGGLARVMPSDRLTADGCVLQ